MILLGDCLIQMKSLPDNSVDSVVTDPPYGLSFMGKKWDYDVPSVDVWREVLRVLKPGGHVLSFGGTRTYHRMVVNIEDAGFDIRDCVTWHYGQGFPKSTRVNRGPMFCQCGESARSVEYNNLSHKTPFRSDTADVSLGDASLLVNVQRLTNKSQGLMGDYPPVDDLHGFPECKVCNKKIADGWGSALKPSTELIALCRKPLEKNLTLAENVLKWGTGGLNIDASRIGTDNLGLGGIARGGVGVVQKNSGEFSEVQGRWPANLILDETAASLMPIENKQSVSRFFYVAKASKRERNAGLEGMPLVESKTMGERSPDLLGNSHNTTGQMPAKNQNHHPTIKPIRLMEYLCRLITPPQGTILDPFCGSGSTGVAASRLGFNFIGCEMNEEYYAIASKRIEAAI